MKRPLILALDIGTSSVRASLYDHSAKPVPRVFIKSEWQFTATPDGGAEMNADEAFAQVAATIDAVLEKSSRLNAEVEYVASCSFWHSLVGVDAKGKPTTKVLGWADTRCGKYSEILWKRFDETDTHNRTGARFHSSYWPAKLLWMRNEFPAQFSKTAKWLSFADLIALRLFGADVTGVSMASGTGIFDIRKCTWDPELMKFLNVSSSSLPAIAESDSETFRLTKTFAGRWPRLTSAKWFPAIGDGAADNIGSGCVIRTKAALMIGTSAAMRVAYKGNPPENIPPGLWCYRIDRKRVIIGGALSDGGGLYRWLKQNLKLPRDAEEQIANREPDVHSLTLLPFLAGERGTGYHDAATGAVLGLTSATSPVDILQAGLESVAYRLAEIFDQLKQVAKIKEIMASGGALHGSPVWAQIIADVLGRDLFLNETEESSSRGAALLALESIATIMNVKTLSKADGRVMKPDRGRFACYRKARKRQADFYKLLIR